MPESIQQEAQAILNILASIPFQDCIAISKEFRELPMRAGIYAVCASHPWNPLHWLSPERCAIAFAVVTKLYFGHSLKN
jgi:hypothetical protein